LSPPAKADVEVYGRTTALTKSVCGIGFLQPAKLGYPPVGLRHLFVAETRLFRAFVLWERLNLALVETDRGVIHGRVVLVTSAHLLIARDNAIVTVPMSKVREV
jgi:hypothetical protein